VVLANLEVTETLGLSFFRRFSCVATLSALFATLVKAETVIAWHRKGFRLFWNRKVRHGKPGRPRVARDVRELIRMISRENPMWGAPRIHGEL